jgi:hypothetical protein
MLDLDLNWMSNLILSDILNHKFGVNRKQRVFDSHCTQYSRPLLWIVCLHLQFIFLFEVAIISGFHSVKTRPPILYHTYYAKLVMEVPTYKALERRGCA